MSSEFEEFLAFKEFKAMKSAASAPPRAPAPPPPPPPAYAVMAAAPLLGPSLMSELFAEPTPSYLSVASKPYVPTDYVLPKLDKPMFRSFDATKEGPNSYRYEAIFHKAMMQTSYDRDDKNISEFFLWRSIYEEHKDRFELRSHMHLDSSGEAYFSYAYQSSVTKFGAKKYQPITFHIYGDIGTTPTDGRRGSPNYFKITGISWWCGGKSETRYLYVQKDDDSRSSISS
jgi:hypothetical protein